MATADLEGAEMNPDAADSVVVVSEHSPSCARQEREICPKRETRNGEGKCARACTRTWQDQLHHACVKLCAGSRTDGIHSSHAEDVIDVGV